MSEPDHDAEDGPSKEVVVRAYGLLSPIDWADDCEEELRLMTQLWNKLVEIDQANRIAVRALTSECPVVAGAQKKIEALKAERVELIAERKARRKAARSGVQTPDIDARLDAIKPLIAAAAATAKEAAQAARARSADRLKDLEQRRRDAVKQARQQSGLWWGNYNAVVDSYEKGRKMAFKRGGEMRFHRHDGSGRITNQIQGGLDVAGLFSGARSQVSVKPLPADAYTHPSRGERRRLSRTHLTATIFTRDGERRNVTWPMIMHRPIPDDVRIKQVVVTRERLANKWVWKAIFTCTREAGPAAERIGYPVAVDLGFRKVAEGVRVATAVRSDRKTPVFVVLPQSSLEDYTHCEDIRSKRDSLLNEAVAGLKTVPWSKAPPEIEALGLNIVRAPRVGFGKVATLALKWRDHRHFEPEAFEALEQWRKTDKRLWLEETNLRDKVGARRKDIYRNLTRDVLHGASEVVLDKLDLAKAAQLESKAGDETPIPAASRHYRTMAAPSEFRLALTQLAQREGIPVRVHEGVSTWVCHACGEDVGPKKPDELRQRCPSCGAHWDQDVNACRIMLGQAPERRRAA